MKDYYSILGLSRNASSPMIKDAYRKLAKKYHPDVNQISGAELIFKEINEAYEVLGEPEKKARYDQPFYVEPPDVKPPFVHRDPAYHRDRPRPSTKQDADRLKELKEEYKNWFLRFCKIGLGFSILIFLDALIPSAQSNEVVKEVYFIRAERRSPSNWVLTTDKGRKVSLYPEDFSGYNFEINSMVVLKISRIFYNVLSITPDDGHEAIWIARIYTRLSFFPILLFVTACLGIIFKSRTELVINCGTISLVFSIVCLFLVL